MAARRDFAGILAVLVLLAAGPAGCDGANFGSVSAKKSADKKPGGDDKADNGGDDHGDDADDGGDDHGDDGQDDHGDDGGADAGDDAGMPFTPKLADDVDQAGDDGGASRIFVGDDGRRKELFDFGGDARSPLVDFVFVVDNSVSMDAIRDKTNAGFASIATQGVFPKRTRVAVMSTMVGKPGNLSTTHPAIKRYDAIDSEPGFLAFVDGAAISSFRSSAGPKIRANWSLDGCKPWFTPTAKSSSGELCLIAHTQSTHFGVEAEAGITAVSQLLEKHSGKRLFRKGAVVNFVFVSDTHDPGADLPGLTNNRPDAAALRTAIEADNTISGLHFHALAPNKKCTEEALWGKSYYPLATATGGIKGDPCSMSDYAPFIKRMAEAGAERDKGVFTVSRSVKRIIKVTVDGKETKDYHVDGDTIRIDGLDPETKVKIAILYEP